MYSYNIPEKLEAPEKLEEYEKNIDKNKYIIL